MSSRLITSHSSLLFLLWVVSVFMISDADPYGRHPRPHPPVPVPGNEHQQSLTCDNHETRCHGMVISCPPQCPTFKPADTTRKACFVDCNSRTCEAVCKKRKPDCEGMGAACYDPRFVGGDGVMFYFHGKKNEHFSLVSDPNLQINARFIGRRPQGRSRDNTWIQALGLMFGSNTFTVEANRVARWNDEFDHFHFTYNDNQISIPPGHLSTWSPPGASGDLLVERTATTNSVTLTLPGVLEMSVNVVPVTEEDDRIHKYQIPSDDCFAHLEVQFKFSRLSEKVEGVLGQTYRPDFQNPVKRGVPMPVMGGEDKFKTSSLLSADCRYCVFEAEATSQDGSNTLALDPEMIIDCSSEISRDHGFVCRR